jgi:broad specificity phosphatase PhoE
VDEWVTRHPDGAVAIVSHGDVIKAILSAALGQPLDQFQRIVVGPGSVSVVRYHGDRSMVLRMNDTGRALPVDRAAGRPTVGGGTG